MGWLVVAKLVGWGHGLFVGWWIVGRFVRGLVGELFSWVVGLSVCQLVVFLVTWFVTWLVGWSVCLDGPLVCWLVCWLVRWLVGWWHCCLV